MTMSKDARSRIYVDESRIWNIECRNVKRLSYTMGYMIEELHILKILNIRGSHRNLSIISPAETNRYLTNFSKYVHVTDWGDVFYCNYNKPFTVLFHISDSVLGFYGGKIQRLFIPKFQHDKNTVNSS